MDQYRHILDTATTYDEWCRAAVALDRLEGKDAWKLDPKSPDYDFELLSSRLEQLRKARES